MSRPELTFAISADYARMTGGWIYDQRLLAGLEALGWAIDRLTLPAGFPDPDEKARAAAAELIAGLPDGTILLVDQLCFSVMPELAQTQRSRLRQVVIVHHPLGFEGDRAAAASVRLIEAERDALAGAALAIATSSATAAILAQQFGVEPSRVVVAPPGSDPMPLARGSSESCPRLLSVGAVVPRKDHGVLLGALGHLAALAWHLDLVGNTARAPAHVAALRRQAAGLGLERRVSFHGELASEALEELWASADLYVASSRHEGFGMAIAEAVGRGLPVVTTAAGAVEGWLDRRAALITPVGDVEALVEVLRQVLADPRRRLALRRGALAARAALPRWEATAAIVDAALRPLAVTREG